MMKMTFRWYGDGDPVTLEQIRQIPVVTGVVSAVYDVPPGEVWSEESISRLVGKCAAAGLPMEVVESVPVHEDIKLGLPSAERYVENYKENIRRLARHGVKCVCYNFMPVFDWTRSDLARPSPDGSNSLSYEEETVRKTDPRKTDLSLPGWDSSYSREELVSLLDMYSAMDGERLWKNLIGFLREVIPVCEETGVAMAIHPDDPPWSLFGLPRIITGKESILRLLRAVDSPANGVTLCAGSLGAAEENDIVEIAHACRGRIPFVHIRNVRVSGRDFYETAHPTDAGSLDIFGLVNTLVEDGFDGYVRPDHGRMIWGERGRGGYGLYDRALGACYLAGLFEGVTKRREKEK